MSAGFERIKSEIEVSDFLVLLISKYSIESGMVVEEVKPHFQCIARYLIDSSADTKKALFETYERCFRGEPVPDRDADEAHNHLRLAGLLKLKNGFLIVRNELYRHFFDIDWIQPTVRHSGLNAIRNSLC